MKYELSPSILSADFARLGEEIKAVEQTGVNYLHIDVMDGMFVPSISFGFPIIKSIRKMSNMVFDVHLMVEQPERYIEETATSVFFCFANTHVDNNFVKLRNFHDVLVSEFFH